MTNTPPSPTGPASITRERRGWLARSLDVVERVGNRLPDPAVLFLLLMVLAWVVSALLSQVSFSEIDPRNGKAI